MNSTFTLGDSTLWGMASSGWHSTVCLPYLWNKILKINSSKVLQFLVLVCRYVCSLRYWQRCICCSYTVSCSAVSKLWPNSMKLNFCRTSCQYIFSYCLHMWYCIWKSGKVIKLHFHDASSERPSWWNSIFRWEWLMAVLSTSSLIFLFVFVLSIQTPAEQLVLLTIKSQSVNWKWFYSNGEQ